MFYMEFFILFTLFITISMNENHCHLGWHSWLVRRFVKICQKFWQTIWRLRDSNAGELLSSHGLLKNSWFVLIWVVLGRASASPSVWAAVHWSIRSLWFFYFGDTSARWSICRISILELILCVYHLLLNPRRIEFDI